MGILATLGALSGAGQGVSAALMEGQKANTAKALEESRQEMENLRQEKTLAAQQKMHTETISSAAEQGQLTREHGTALAKIHGEIVTGEGAKTRASHEQIAKDTNALHERTTKATNDLHRLIGSWQKDAEKYKTDTSLRISTQTAAVGAMKDLEYEITRLNTIVNTPTADPNSPDIKAAKLGIDRARHSMQAYDAFLQNALGIKVEVPSSTGGPRAGSPVVVDPFKQTSAAAPSTTAPSTEMLDQPATPSNYATDTTATPGPQGMLESLIPGAALVGKTRRVP
jgi:hypothetical protein